VTWPRMSWPDLDEARHAEALAAIPLGSVDPKLVARIKRRAADRVHEAIRGDAP
jgi:hypothetical protein